MEYRIPKEKEIVCDIENGEANHGVDTKHDLICKGKKSLNKLVSGVLGFNGSFKGEPASMDRSGVNRNGEDEKPLLAEKNTDAKQSQGILPIVNKDDGKETQKVGNVKKASKPPRPPRGPSLDAYDMRLVREISKIAMKKRERIERMKALKKVKAAKLQSQSSSSSSSGGTISAMVITVLFFLVIVFQGLGSSSSSNMILTGAPEPAPETTDLTHLQFYQTVLSDDGAAPGFIPPKSA